MSEPCSRGAAQGWYCGCGVANDVTEDRRLESSSAMLQKV